MSKTPATLALEEALYERSRARHLYGCTEVTIGFPHEGKGDEIVDFMSMDADRNFRCYELKVSLSDLKSDAKKSWYGDYNYLVVSDDLYRKSPAWDNWIPPYCGILSGTELIVKRKPQKKPVLDQDRLMLEDSLIRSVYFQMDHYRNAGNKEKQRELQKQIEDLQSQMEMLKQQTDRLAWNYKDYERSYQRNHQNSHFSIEAESKKERSQYQLRKEGKMYWQNKGEKYFCPVCHHKVLYDDQGDPVLTDYCPYCGSDLRKLEEK